MTSKERIKVLYIAGPSRSGSTLLSNILGEIAGFFNAGELIDFWEWALEKDGRCGCGVPVRSCPVWDDVVAAFSNRLDTLEKQELIKLITAEIHSWKVPLWQHVPPLRAKMMARLAEYRQLLQVLYETIRTAQECRVIIDSSKNAAYAYQLSRLSQIDLYVVHFIRDPRATAFSWMRRKKGLHRERPLQSTTVWASRNLFTAQLQSEIPGKYLRMYYEDFVSAPRHAVKEILKLIRECPATLPFVTDQQIELTVNHSIYGNPDRYQSGRIRLKADEEWQKMEWTDKLLVTALTWPFLLNYGYSLHGRAPHRKHDQFT